MPAKRFLLSALCVLLSVPAWAAVNVGDKPDLAFQALDGTQVDRAYLDGKIVVVDFWATWCGPCMAEAPHMVKLYDQYSKQGMIMVGISLDRSRDALLKVSQEKGFVWPQFMDSKGQFSGPWGVTGIPSTFILSPEGEVLWKGHPGNIDAPLADAFKNHPPRLIDARTMALAKDLLAKLETSVKTDPAAAAKLYAKMPPEAKKEKLLTKQLEPITKELEAFGDKQYAEAATLVEAKDFIAALPKLRELATYKGLAAATKAEDQLKTLVKDPQVKASLDAADKAAKEKERQEKAAELLAAAQKLQEAKKHELAYSQFKMIAAQFAGTSAAETAAAEVKKYDADVAFAKRARDAEAASKAKGMMSMAENYRAAGKIEEAKKRYQAIIEQFPGTSFAEQAKKAIDELK